jgi:hypothetical protein
VSRVFTLSVGDVTWALEPFGVSKRLVVCDDEGNDLFVSRAVPPPGADEPKYVAALLDIYRAGFSDGSRAGERDKMHAIKRELGL